MAEVVEVACGIGPMLMGETVENVASGIDCYTIRQPVGVRRSGAGSSNHCKGLRQLQDPRALLVTRLVHGSCVMCPST